MTTWIHRGLGVLVMVLGACQASSGTREPDDYQGCATDELWQVFDQAERTLGTGNDTTAPSFAAPIVEGAQLAPTTPPQFNWQLTSSEAGNATGNATCAQCATCGTTTLVPQHLPEVSGEAFDLQLRSNGQVLYRVLTTMQQWTPPAVQWADWAGRTIELTTVRLTVVDNVIAGSAYRATRPLTFRVNAN